MSYKYFDQDYDSFLAHADVKSEDMKYGLPEKKAYPMPDRKHVLSAIKFFNYVSPKDEGALAKAILARMEEYGISEVNVGPDNRFGKYYKPSLEHYGIPGQRKGQRRWQNPDGSWTPAGRLKYGKGGAPRGSYNTKSLPAGRGREKWGPERKYDRTDENFRSVDISDPRKWTKEDREFLADIGFFDKNNLWEDGELNTNKHLSGRIALEKGPEAYKSKKEYLEAITKDCLYDPNNLKEHEDDPKMKARVLDAVDLGLKAVENLRGPGYVDLDNADQTSNREWFLFEDQTIGMPTVADLISQGYTSKEVKKLIDELDTNYDHDLVKDEESTLSITMFQVRNGDDLKAFADECEKVKAQEAKEKDNVASNEDNEVAKPTRAEQKLEKTQAKLDAAKEKQSSEKYQKNVEKKDKLERQLEALGLKTQKIRDNKLFRDKEPGFFDRMKLNKEARLQKKLSKINKKINKVDDSVNKLTKKQDKYQQKVDRAKRNDKYDIDFLETVQNDAVLRKGGKDLQREYKKYLNDPDKYRSTFQESSYQKQYKNKPEVREAMRIARADGWGALTDKQKELLNELQ